MSGPSGSSPQCGEALILEPCAHCNRTFAPSVLVKHQAICGRVLKKRQPFDSALQRLEAMSSHLQVSQPASRPTVRPRSPSADGPAARSRSRNVTRVVKAASTATASAAAPASAASSKAAPTRERNELERSPRCERSFGMEKSVASAVAGSGQNKEKLQAKKRLEARMSYKPPKPKARQTSH